MEGRNKNFSCVPYWEKRYLEKHTHWHINSEHPVLVENISVLTNNTRKKFFIPLCGKTKDIPYLLSLGHDIFAVEGVKQPILELESENSIKLNFNEEESLYYTDDLRLKIYFGDFFKCPIEKYGPFDCVWDRASFDAVEYSSRKEYVAIIQRSLKNSEENFLNFKYLLQTYSYDKSKFSGPPTAVDPADLQEYFSGWAAVEEINRRTLPERKPFPQYTEEVYYLLQPVRK